MRFQYICDWSQCLHRPTRMRRFFFASPAYLKLLLCWQRSFTQITYLCKLIGLHSLAALPQLQILWGSLAYLKLLLCWLLSPLFLYFPEVFRVWKVFYISLHFEWLSCDKCIVMQPNVFYISRPRGIDWWVFQCICYWANKLHRPTQMRRFFFASTLP